MGGFSARALVWFAATQAGIQAITMGVGLLTANHLSKPEYAAYSLNIGAMSAAALIAGSGFTSVLLSRGSQLRGDTRRYEALVSSVMAARLRVGAMVAVPTTLLLVLLLSKVGLSSSTVFVQASIFVATFALTLKATMYECVLSLEYDRKAMQAGALLGGGLRLGGTLSLMSAEVAPAWAFLILNTTCVAIHRAYLIKAAGRYISAIVQPEQELIKDSLKANAQLLPSSITLALQGQFVAMVLAWLGLQHAVADVSALSRVTAGFAVVILVSRGMMAPIVARATDATLGRVFLAVAIGSTASMGIVAAALAAEPRLVLSVLGSKYGDLGTELRIILLAGVLASSADMLASLNEARGWIGWMWLQAPLAVGATTVAVMVIRPQTAMDGACLALVGATPGIVIQVLQAAIGLRLNMLPDRSTEAHEAQMEGH